MKRARLSNEPTDLNRSNSEKRFKSNPSSRKSIPTSSTSLPLYEKPYQHETGVDLNFNFWTWQNNQYLNASTHLYELFSVLIESKNVSFLKPIEPSFKFNSMVVVNLTHLDPISFNEYVTKLRLKGSKPKTAAKASKSFFAQSSSMPIHCEMKIDDRSRHISDYVPAFESIVWRDKAVIDLSAFLLYKGVRSKLIFADHVLVFKMVQGDRNENVFLTPSTTCQREKQVSHWTSLKSTYDSTDIDHIYGTFKLSTTSLSGNYRYEHAAGAEGRSVLSLQWIQPQPQLHVLISDVAVNPDDDSSSDDDDDTNKFRDLNNPFSALEDNIGTGAHSSFSITFKEVGISTQETSLRLDLSCAYSASLESEDSVEIDSTLGNLATTTQTINTHSELKSTTLSDLASTFERNEEKARYFLRLPETLHSILGFPCALEVQQHGYLDSSRLWLYSTFSHAYSAKTLVQDSIPSLNATVSVGTSLNHIHFSGAELEEGELDEVENQEPSVHVPAAVAESEGKPETIKQVEINGRQVSLPSCPLSICGLDCEMCVTDAGLELTRITVVCPHRGVILDELVRPARTIINYNTAFSGITEETLTGVTATLKDIQKLLAWFINVNTLVVGHSLDSDLHALKLAHSCVCDTSALYPHHKGLPFKNSLKKLALEVLGKAIQDAGTDVSNPLGHDSAQDAQIALELALHKFERHLNNPLVDEYIMNNTGIFLGTKCTLFEELAFSIKKQSSTLGICVASADKYDGRNVWEAYSLGYKPDSRPFEVLNKRMSDQTALCNTKHDTSKEAIKAAIDYLQATKRDQKEQSTPSLVWVDIPAEVPDEGMCRELDLSLDELFQASNIGTMMLVVGQGSLEPLRSLLAKKQRAQWDIAQRQSNLKIADTPTVSWDDIDDQNLSLAAASVASGVAFIRSK